MATNLDLLPDDEFTGGYDPDVHGYNRYDFLAEKRLREMDPFEEDPDVALGRKYG